MINVKMKLIFVMILLAGLVLIIPVAAAPGGLNNGKVQSGILVEKNPSDWTIIPDGAWGKLTYKSSDMFVFNGHKVNPNTEYALVNYINWGVETQIIGTSTSNPEGNIHISGDMITLINDASKDPVQNYKSIWLVPTSDMTDKKITSWNPSNYLFEMVSF